MMPKLRDYQQAAVDSIYKYFETKSGHPLVVCPTGGGKSLIIASFIKGAIEQYPNCRIVMLTHQRELLSQNFAELIKFWPQAPATLYSAGLGSKDISGQILIAGIQSIHKHAMKVQAAHLILIDEAHLLSENQNSMYRKFLSELNTINGGLLKVVGFTATPYRLSSGLLHEGKDRLFTDVCYNISILDLIKQGHLCPIVPKKMETQLDTSGVGTSGGEFIASQLQEAVDKDEVTKAAVAEIVDSGANRKAWAIYCTGVQHATHVRDEIRSYGISCELVTGETPPAERDAILQNFKTGKLRAVTNVGVWTTGLNAPRMDLIALLRPTKSASLLVQIAGRGTRLYPGKTECLFLDFGGATDRFGPIDMIDGSKKHKGAPGEAPIKSCPECEAQMPISARECLNCGYVFEIKGTKLNTKASTAPLLSTQVEPLWVDVESVRYAPHNKPDKPTSLRVTYRTGLLAYSEWCCIQHAGWARQKAERWWLARGQSPVPATVEEALSRVKELRKPAAIQIRPLGKHVEITGAKFA